MKGRTVYGIALDGNGNPERACQVEASGPVKTSFTVEEVEALRDELIQMFRNTAARQQRKIDDLGHAPGWMEDVEEEAIKSRCQSYKQAAVNVEQKFSALLSKIKN
jgi:hypothetical protein